jgi:hypothetical protein
MILFLLASLLAADPEATTPELAWANRVEGAAVRLRTQAEQLAETGHRIAGEGRMQELAVLHSDAASVKTRADQLLLWAAQAPSLQAAAAASAAGDAEAAAASPAPKPAPR